jgi:hypothetical protein
VLTAIVIAMATTTILLTLAALGRSDDTRSVEPDDDQSPLTTTARSLIKPGHTPVDQARAAVGDVGIARDTRAAGKASAAGATRPTQREDTN